MGSTMKNLWLLGILVISLPGWSKDSSQTSISPSSSNIPVMESEMVAWETFVNINKKNEQGKLIWETWMSQACLNNPTDCPTQRLSHSELRAANHADDPKRTGGCSPMTTESTASASLKPFLPKNLSANPVFCEEVTINDVEQSYAEKHKLLTVEGQENYLKSGGIIDFPWGAIEVKADWVPASSFTDVTFNCSEPSESIYTEMIDGKCYGLVGMHISLKNNPNWLWATFEPQYSKTNPNRCNPKLYNACVDSWGSSPAKSTGEPTKPTPQLLALFQSAGKSLDPAFQNYRLTGVQTEFNQPLHSKGVLGSSFVEYNAQVPAHQASCITCHSYAERSTKTGNTPPGGAPSGYPSVGPRKPLSADYKSLDFSWFLGFGVPK